MFVFPCVILFEKHVEDNLIRNSPTTLHLEPEVQLGLFYLLLNSEICTPTLGDLHCFGLYCICCAYVLLNRFASCNFVKRIIAVLTDASNTTSPMYAKIERPFSFVFFLYNKMD